MAILETKIDWITATYRPQNAAQPVDADEARLLAYALLWQLDFADYGELVWAPAPAQRFYKWSFYVGRVCRVDVAEDITKQGIRLVMSSTALQAGLRSPHALIWNLNDEGWKFTRIDVAFDVFDSGVKPVDVMEMWKADGVNAAARSYSFIVGSSGETFTVGSRQSPVFGRAYDKGAEQASSKDWLRLELELKYDAPEQFVQFLQFSPESLWAEMCRRFGLVGTTLGEFIKAQCGGGEVPLYSRHRTITNTEKWLHDQVLPAIKKLEKNESGAALRFMETLATWLAGEDET